MKDNPTPQALDVEEVIEKAEKLKKNADEYIEWAGDNGFEDEEYERWQTEAIGEILELLHHLQGENRKTEKENKILYEALEKIGTMLCECPSGCCTCADDMVEIVEHAMSKLSPTPNE